MGGTCSHPTPPPGSSIQLNTNGVVVGFTSPAAFAVFIRDKDFFGAQCCHSDYPCLPFNCFWGLLRLYFFFFCRRCGDSGGSFGRSATVGSSSFSSFSTARFWASSSSSSSSSSSGAFLLYGSVSVSIFFQFIKRSSHPCPRMDNAVAAVHSSRAVRSRTVLDELRGVRAADTCPTSRVRPLVAVVPKNW